MTQPHPPKDGIAAWTCRNCGNDPVLERDDRFSPPMCPRCGETVRLTRRALGPP